MVCVCGDDKAGAAGAGPRDAQGEVVGLAAGAGEHDVTDPGRQGGEQPFRVVEDGLVQIARVRVEDGSLSRHRFHDMRVAVSDRCDVIITVEIAIAGRVVEPDAFASDKFYRLFVEQPVRGTEQAIATYNHVSGRTGLSRD